MGCKGIHCPGCGHGGRAGLAAIAVVLALAVCAAKRHAIEHGAGELLRDVLVIAAVTVAIAVAVVVGVMVLRVRQLAGPMRRLAEAQDRAAEAMTAGSRHVIQMTAEDATPRAIEAGRPAWPQTADLFRTRDGAEVNR